MFARLIIALIYSYRFCISPFIPGRCRFVPTCSQYAIHAIEYHGVLKGLWLALKRLCRCHPYGSYGYDPISKHSHTQK
ncbi:MAG: membrane protein insertion efficiency factor YidD [Proteobacteria bacterium]|nr:membrane protein insertion efficiency factor YidD [Pseudomonadota bacterium]